jgi:hypothetical protein
MYATSFPSLGFEQLNYIWRDYEAIFSSPPLFPPSHIQISSLTPRSQYITFIKSIDSSCVTVICSVTMEYARLQTSTAVRSRLLLSWVVMQHMLLAAYRRFGTAYRSNLQGSWTAPTLEDRTNRSSRKVCKQLATHAI